MTRKEIDPADLIDRDQDQEVFAELLECLSDVRVLTVTDDGGRGKSALLQRLEYNCRYREPKAPAALMLLDQITDATAFKFVESLREAYRKKSKKLEFPNYDQLKEAYAVRDYSRFGKGQVALTGSVTADGATFMAGSTPTLAGVNLNAGVANFNVLPEWTPDQFAIAGQRCIEAFLKDLQTACELGPIAILLDAWERGSTALCDWICDELLQNCIFDADGTPPKLFVIIAGRKLPNLKDRPGSHYTRLVRPGGSLRGWDVDHVQSFLRLHGFPNVPERDAKYLTEQIGEGLSLEDAKLFVANWVNKRRAS